MERINTNQTFVYQRPQVTRIYQQNTFRPVVNNADILDIRSRGKFPANVLSNFSKTDFTFDGVKVKSIEGFLQSLKIKDPTIQEKMCALGGFDAKKASKSIKRAKEDMMMFWNGQSFRRDSKEYKELLKQVVALQEQNPNQPFEFGGKKIASVNAFLLALKVQDPEKQKELCALPLDKVKEAAREIEPIYDSRTLYWKGKPIARTSNEYANLLEKLYVKRFKNDATFRDAIRESKHFHLIHSIGKQNPSETILTEKEFIGLLEKLQSKDNYFYKFKDFFTSVVLKKALHK